MSEESKNCASDQIADVVGGFAEHKRAAIELARDILPHSIWYRDRAPKISQCGTFIRLQPSADDSAVVQLTSSNLCRVRLCPMCEWRLSLRRYVALRAAVDYLGDSCAWLHLVLTVPNVSGAELSGAISALYARFRTFWRDKRPLPWLGYYRGLEITYNAARDDFHPHLHCLIAVDPKYFKSRHYRSQADLQKQWGAIVYVKRLRDLGHGIAEVVKYACKPLHVSDDLPPAAAAAAYDVLARALHGRRMVQAGDCVREALRTVGQLDALDSMDGGADQTDDTRASFGFYWHFGENKYVPIIGQKEV